MKPLNPPVPATWLLKHFGPQLNAEALAGDLQEEFRQGRSNAWYWRQVLAVIRWRRHLFTLVLVASYAWYLPGLSAHRLPAAIVVTATWFISIYLPGMLSTAQRIASGAASLILGVLSFAIFPSLGTAIGSSSFRSSCPMSCSIANTSPHRRSK